MSFSRRDAPERSVDNPLCRTEPIFRRIAEARNPGRILFQHEVVDLNDEGDHVRVTVLDNKGQPTIYRAQYVVGADGGKTVGSRIGAMQEGEKAITDMVSVHFGADLSQYWNDREFVRYLINGAGETILESGAVIPTGPSWGKDSEEWIFNVGFDMGDEARHDETSLINRIRTLFRIPDLEMKIFKISHWVLDCVLASKYSEGRIFLAGDSAHRHPPTTGLGLNTGIEDALNLAWKLALVIKEQADPRILCTYEQERRSVGRRNCDWALLTFENSAVINAAIGLVAGSNEANARRLQALFTDTEIGRSRLAQVQRIVESQNVEFTAHDIELGFSYQQGWKLPDGTPLPPVDPLGQIYRPTTRPGHRLPHAWLERDGVSLSTHDLVGRRGDFVVITDTNGRSWKAAAEKCSQVLSLPIRTVCVDRNSDYESRDGQWDEVKGVGKGGAILVRPDNFVAWRSCRPSTWDGAELQEALNVLLWGKHVTGAAKM